MDRATMREMVATARVGRLATVTVAGRPHLVPICFALLGEVAYSAVDHKPKRSRRLRRLDNARATGHASLLVDGYDEDWAKLWWVRLDGAARVLVDGEPEAVPALDVLVAKYPQYADRRPTGPVLALDITAWSAWSAT